MTATDDVLASAAAQLSETYVKCVRNFITIRALRTLAAKGLDTLPDHLRSTSKTVVETVLGRTDFELAPETVKALTDESAWMFTWEAVTALNAASLVFAHSILDDAVTTYCRISASVDPDAWERYISERKISLAEVKESGTFENCRSLLIKRYVVDLEGKSLRRRLDVLNALCQPPPERRANQTSWYKYDPEQISALDQRRQDVIHRVNLRETASNIEADLEYLSQTCIYAGNLIIVKYNIPFDGEAMDEAIKTFRAPTETALHIRYTMDFPTR
jgi:hypothetical protein